MRWSLRTFQVQSQKCCLLKLSRVMIGRISWVSSFFLAYHTGMYSTQRLRSKLVLITFYCCDFSVFFYSRGNICWKMLRSKKKSGFTLRCCRQRPYEVAYSNLRKGHQGRSKSFHSIFLFVIISPKYQMVFLPTSQST